MSKRAPVPWRQDPTGLNAGKAENARIGLSERTGVLDRAVPSPLRIAHTARQAASRRPGRPRPEMEVLPWCSPEALSRGHSPACPSSDLGEAKRTGSPVSARIAAAPAGVSPAIVVTRAVRPRSSRTATIRAPAPASRAQVSRQSPSARCARSSAPGRCTITPAGSRSAAQAARTIRRHGRAAPHRGSSRRTAPSNRAGPRRTTRLRSPAQRSSTTASAARQVAGRNGLPDAPSTAGQAHSSRSRIWLTCAVASVVSWRRRAHR